MIKPDLIQGFSLRYFTQVPEVDNCVHNYQTRAVNKSNLKNFLTEQNASSIIYFFFMLVNRTAWKTPCAKQNLSNISNQC